MKEVRPPRVFGLAALVVLFVGLAEAQAPKVWIPDNEVVQEQVRELDAAILREDWNFVVAAAQEIIDDHPSLRGRNAEDSTTPGEHIHLFPDPSEVGVAFSTREYTLRRLAGLPDAALAVYFARHDETTLATFRRSENLQDLAALHDLGARFRLARGGQDALLYLGHFELERGAADRAARHFEDLLRITWRPATTRVPKASAALGLGVAWSSLGRTEALRRLVTQVKSWPIEESRVSFAGVNRPLHEVLEEMLQNLPKVQPEAALGALKLSWSSPDSAKGSTSLPLLRARPLLRHGVIYYHLRDAARALRVEDGSAVWTVRFGRSRNAGAATIPPLLGRHLRSAEGVLSASNYLMVGEDSSGERFLAALDLSTGGLSFKVNVPWTHLDGRVLPLRLDPAPRVVEDRVFLTATDHEANPNVYFLSLDASNGKVHSAVRVNSGVPLAYVQDDGELPPAEHFLGCTPMAIEDRIAYFADNLGTFCALEIDSGRPRFRFSYPRRTVESSSRFTEARTARGFDGSPVISDGIRVAFAPDDADEWFLFEKAPPDDVLLREKNRNYLMSDRGPREGLQTLVGHLEGRMRFVGFDEIMDMWCILEVSPRDRERIFRWSLPLDTPALGMPAGNSFEVYICSERYVYRVDALQGAISNPLWSREKDGTERLGNVVRVPGGGLLIGSSCGVARVVEAGN